MAEDEHRVADIRVPGEMPLAYAGELKQALREGFAAGGGLRVDARAARLDIPLLQLLSAAARQAQRSGVPFSVLVSPELRAAACDAGFDTFPGDSLRNE
jgi:hypothetical protein